MNNRAYAVLEIKSVDEEKRIIRGVATTPSVDRMGDIIDPLGVKFQNPLAFLWQHDHEAPVGQCSFSKPSKSGIEFEAEFVHPDTVESASLKDRLQMAWDSVKAGLVRAVSIGFRPLEYAFMDAGGIRYVETEVYELSAVTIPANAEALINQIKSVQGDDGVMRALKAVDREFRLEHGIPDPEIPEAPKDEAATGKKSIVVKLDAQARDRAPFEIKKIHSERKP